MPRPVLLALLSLASCAPPSLPAQRPPDASATDPVPQRGNDWWRPRHDLLLTRARPGTARLVFLGDSLIQRWETTGADAWERYYIPRKAINLGAGGDKTQHILWRLDHGAIDGLHPDAVVVLAGTNNLDTNTPEEVARGVGAIVARLRDRLPRTRVLLLGILPRGAPGDPVRARIRSVNDLIRGLDDGRMVRYLDLGPTLAPDGIIPPSILPDGLHLSADGYRRWAEAMESKLGPMLQQE